MKIAIIGSGYVGLTTGTCLAELGNTVTCIDNNEEKIQILNNGEMPIFEPGLAELVKKNVSQKRLFFSTDIKNAVKSAEIVFIAVGTPPKPNGDADLSFVENVAKEIAKSITNYIVVVEKSTVPVETGEKVARTIENSGVSRELFDVASNPEFLREGSAIHDFMHPDRIVVGANSEKAREKLEELYKPLNAPIVFTDIRTAEIIKHASNSFLATKISFINAISRICELSGANVEEVALGMGLDRRIGKEFLKAGIGYGGSCFPKDVSAFIQIAKKKGYDFRLLKEVEEINKAQTEFFLKKIEETVWNLNGKTIAVLGLSFKPNTDDLREAPSIKIISALEKEGAKIKAFDPAAMGHAKTFLPNAAFCKNIYECLFGADAALILTEWDEFKKIDLKKAKQQMNTPVFIDGRNMFDQKKMKENGFNYISIGR